MHHRLSQNLSSLLIALYFIVMGAGFAPAWGDDSGLLGRLFRLGGGSSDSSASSGSTKQSSPLPYGRDLGPTGSAVPPMATSPLAPAPMVSNFNGLPQAPVTTPPVPSGPAQRLAPRPRVTQAVTTADPVLTRLALGRSNDGSQFGMFLQVFADGTVVDSEGVHHIRGADFRPILDAVQSGELYRVRGHCGAPSTDFIDYVHVVIYERRLGRLTANSFSYSGNTQGCDQAIRHLHSTIENLQTKLSRQSMAPGVGAGPAGLPAPLGPSTVLTPAGSSMLPAVPAAAFAIPPGAQPSAPASNPAAGGPSGAVIPLTPLE